MFTKKCPCGRRGGPEVRESTVNLGRSLARTQSVGVVARGSGGHKYSCKAQRVVLGEVNLFRGE